MYLNILDHVKIYKPFLNKKKTIVETMTKLGPSYKIKAKGKLQFKITKKKEEHVVLPLSIITFAPSTTLQSSRNQTSQTTVNAKLIKSINIS